MTETLPNNQTECSKDAVKKDETETSKDTVKRGSKTATSKPTVKTVGGKGTVKDRSTVTSEHPANTVSSKSKNRNGKLGIDKKNDYASVRHAPRKLCNNCGSSQHLTHVCKKPTGNKINVTKVNGNLHRTPIMQRTMNVCSNIDCMPCKITAMSTCFNLPILSTEKCSYVQIIETSEPAEVSEKATPTKKKTMSYSKPKWVVKEVNQKLSVSDYIVKNENVSIDTKDAGPNKDWVPDAN
jgi:hypothetical protein